MLLSAHQTAQALLMLQGGVVIGLLYWLFYPLRQFFRKSLIGIFFTDIIFSLLAGGIFYFFLLASSYGELYFFSIFSSFAGFLLQYAAIHPIIEAITHHRRKVKHRGGGKEEQVKEQTCTQK